MKINEVEQSVGITKKNIRFYEQEGLLQPSRNLSNGYRDYSEEDVRVLRQIKLLRKLGIPISEIKKLQEHYLTLEDCLRRHLVTLERESKNLMALQKFSSEMISQNISLDTMDAEKLLSDMENMEEGGTRFVDIRKRDKKRMKRSALIAACCISLTALFPIVLMAWTAVHERKAIGVMSVPIVIFVIIAIIVIGGAFLALRERFREIEGGELDEASKY